MRYLLFLCLVVLASCEEDITPKPRGYFRIDLPEKGYTEYALACPVTFDVPSYAQVELIPGKNTGDTCLFNLSFPRQHARLHCTYFPVDGNIDELVKDAYGFAAKHEMKATGLRRTLVEDPERKVYGIVYDIEGEAASQVQFFLTDSSQHFLRGSLYFLHRPNPDSIAPVLAFIRDDVFHIAQSVRWGN